MSNINKKSLTEKGWRAIADNVTGTGKKKVKCGFVYVKDNLVLEHDEIIDWVVVKQRGAAPTLGMTTIVKGERHDLQELLNEIESSI